MAEALDPVEIIDAHLEQYFEEEDVIVFHEIDTPEEENHIDIYWIRPSKDFLDYAMLLTVGMSRVSQNIEEASHRTAFIEVIMLVPHDWDFSNYKWTDDEYWPIHHLKTIAKIPSMQDTWLGYGHSISWKNDGTLIPGTGFNASVLLSTRTLLDEFVNIKVDEQKKIQILRAVPVFPEELNFKIEHTADALVDKFNHFDIDEVVDINRRNTCRKKWWKW